MGYDITYHPASKADIQQAYFQPLKDRSVNEDQLNQLSSENKQRYIDLVDQGKQAKNTSTFDTTHGYFAANALGFFQSYYYIRGAGFSFLLQTYPYYRQYVERWHSILPDFTFHQQVENEITENYSSGVYLSSAGVKQLWVDYHNNPMTKLELDYYFDTDIQQFLSALNDARQQNKGLLEATEVYSPFEGNASSEDNLIVKNNTPFEPNLNLSLEKQYYQTVNTILDSSGKPTFTALEQLKATYPFPEKIEFALGWLKDVVGKLPEAESHYQQAIELGFDDFITHHFFGEFYRLIKKDKQRAIAQYEISLSKNPNYELNHIRIGDLAEEERDWKAAKAAYEKAIAIYPLQAEYYNNLGVYEGNLFNFKKGIEHFRRAIQINHNYFDAYQNLAWQLYKTHEYDESQEVALLALTKCSNKGSFYDVLGRASLKMGDKQQALDYFTSSIQECPQYAPSYCELANIFDNDSDKVLDILNQCLDNNPDYGFAYYKRAKTYSRNGNYQQAEADFLTAIDLGDITANTYVSLGFVYSEGLKQPQKAIDAYQKAIEINPNDEMAHRNMAISYWDLGESEKALQKLDKALDLVPDTYITLLNKGIYLQQLKRYDEAIVAFENLLQHYPYNQKGQINLAHMYYQTQQWFDAIAHYKKVLLSESTHITALYETALSYYQLGHYAIAGYCYEKLLEIDPQATDYFNRGLCHEQLGNLTLAIADYRQAIQLQKDYDKAQNALLHVESKQRQARKTSWNPFAKRKGTTPNVEWVMPEIAACVTLARLCGWSKTHYEALLSHLQQADIRFNSPYDIVTTCDNFSYRQSDKPLLFIYLDWKETIDEFNHKLGIILQQCYGIDEVIPLGDWQPDNQLLEDGVQEHFARYLQAKDLQLTYIDSDGDDYLFVVHPIADRESVEQQINLLGWDCFNILAEDAKNQSPCTL